MTPADTMRDGNLTPAGDKVAQDRCDEGYERELEALAVEALAAEYEATAPAGKYVARDFRSGNLSPDNQRAIRAMLRFACALADRQPNQRGGEVECTCLLCRHVAAAPRPAEQGEG